MDFRDIAKASAELAVSVGIIEAAIDHSAPDDVKENFREKVEGIVANLHRETEEIMDFAEAYD